MNHDRLIKNGSLYWWFFRFLDSCPVGTVVVAVVRSLSSPTTSKNKGHITTVMQRHVFPPRRRAAQIYANIYNHTCEH